MIKFEELNGVDLRHPSVFNHPAEPKKSVIQTENEKVIPKSSMVDMKETGKGTKIDTHA